MVEYPEVLILLNFFSNWLVAFATPIFLANSAFDAYFLFGFLTLGTVIALAGYMPETRGRSLESIQEAFHHRPVMRSWTYQLRWLYSRTGISPASSDNPASERNTIEIATVAGAGEGVVNVSSVDPHTETRAVAETVI